MVETTADDTVDVVGLIGGRPCGDAAASALAAAEVVVGSAEQLALANAAGVIPPDAERVELGRGLSGLPTRSACVLASGDPGFFGIVRTLAARLGPERVVAYPAPSSIAMAFGRLGLPWDDALVVSAHAHDLDGAVSLAATAPKVAVLVSPEAPPEAVGKALLSSGAHHQTVAVCSRLGEPGEAVTLTDLDGLASGTFDARSVVVLLSGHRANSVGDRRPAWGRPIEAFAHRASMITKPEVRAVVLAKLDLPSHGVLWDVGAGSGSVAIEAALAAPGLRVIAVERRADDAARIRANAAVHGALVEVVEGSAPDALVGLPAPDRIFVGGGGLDVLDACLARVRRGGVVVASYAAMDRAAAARERLGSLVQVAVDRAETLPDGGVRLAADNPVFVAWGSPGRGGHLTVGIGCSSTATEADVRDLVAAAGIELADIGMVATIDVRHDHPGIRGLGLPVRSFPAADLAAVAVPSPSAAVADAVGTPSVAEAAALLAAGPGSRLLLTKHRSATATVALAGPAGAITVVGLGPGDVRHRTVAAVEAVRGADVVVGYAPYVDLCADLLRPDQRVVRGTMGEEAQRARVAVAEAARGSRVAVVSSGDAGVYGMAGLVVDAAASHSPPVAVEIIPGVTAATAAAALLGAPLGRDFAAISLSDLLVPWSQVAGRVEAVARSGLALALYNPRSKGRPSALADALEILRRHRELSTPVGLVSDAGRPGERVVRATLADVDPERAGMTTIVLVAGAGARVVDQWVIADRGSS